MNGQVFADKKKDEITGYTVTQYLVGPHPNGPKRCFYCRRPFLAGEAWQRLTSPPDPEYGSYVIGVHDKCLCR